MSRRLRESVQMARRKRHRHRRASEKTDPDSGINIPARILPARITPQIDIAGFLGLIAKVKKRSPMERFAFHHVGIAVRDLSNAIPIYKNLFEYELTSGPFDDPIQNVTVCFLSRGNEDTVLELVAPLGPNSPIDRTLKKGGGPTIFATKCPTSMPQSPTLPSEALS